MKHLITILFLLTSVVLPIQSQTVNETKAKQMLNKIAVDTKSIQCDFIQTKHLKMLNDKLVSKGKMFYQQGNKLHWEYTNPYQYTFILNNNQVLIRNNNHSDVIDVQQNKLFKEIARIMMNSVVGKCLNDEKDFKSSITDNSNEWIAQLLPLKKSMKQMFSNIELHFSKSNSMISKVIITEKNGDKTVIELKNIKKNASINSNIFQIN